MIEISKQEYEKARKIISQFNEIRKKKEEKRHKKIIEKLNGNCYKFRNSYGIGESWWLFSKVVGLKDDSLIVENIQSDSTGRLSIERYLEYLPNCISTHTSISDEEYMEKTNELLVELEMIK